MRTLLIILTLILSSSLTAQTTKYTEWLKAYDVGMFKAKTMLGVKIVVSDYKPDPKHRLKDISGVLMDVPDALSWEEFTKNGMGQIIEKIQTKTISYVEKNQDVALTSVSLVSKDQKEKIEQFVKTDDRKFETPKEGGVAYMVVYCKELGIACFCEELN